MQTEKPQFPLGQVVMTRGVQAMVAEGLLLDLYIDRHVRGDWGDTLSDDDKEANDASVDTNEGRILSSYKTPCGDLWIITEEDRSATTALKPDEY